MVDAFLIDWRARHAERKDPSPGNAKCIALYAGGRHSCDVLLVQIVAQVCNTRPVEQLLRYGGTTSFIHAGTLSLHGGRTKAEDKILGECMVVVMAYGERQLGWLDQFAAWDRRCSWSGREGRRRDTAIEARPQGRPSIIAILCGRIRRGCYA